MPSRVTAVGVVFSSSPHILIINSIIIVIIVIVVIVLIIIIFVIIAIVIIVIHGQSSGAEGKAHKLSTFLYTANSIPRCLTDWLVAIRPFFQASLHSAKISIFEMLLNEGRKKGEWWSERVFTRIAESSTNTVQPLHPLFYNQILPCHTILC